MNFKLPLTLGVSFLFLFIVSASIYGQIPPQHLPTQTADTHVCDMDFTLEDIGVFCNEETGKIKVTITGGTAPFTIRWDSNELGIWGMATSHDREFTIDHLPTGIYHVDVADDAGCFLKKKICLTDQVNTLGLEITVLSTACDLTGTINIKVKDSMPPYWVIVSGPIEPTGFYVESSNFNIRNLPVSGTYEIRVIMGECELSYFVDITVADELLTLHLENDNSVVGGVATTITGGHPPYRLYYNGPTKGLTMSDGEKLVQNLAPGDYEFIVIDKEMCTVSARITVPGMMGMGNGMGQGDRVINSTTNTLFNTTQLGIHQVYPNPAVDLINFTISTGNYEEVNVLVRDMFGRIISSQQYQGAGQLETASFPLGGLSSGMYFLELNTDKEIKTQKFLKK